MAITAKVLPVATKNPPGKTLFAINFYSATSAGIVKAAPDTGKAIYVTMLQIAGVTDGTAILGDGTTDITVVTTGEGLATNFKFYHPIKFADATALTLSGTSGPVSGFIEGFVSN